MGTRNLTVVIKDGERKVAQYGQWDGYPTGQGETVVSFLQSIDKEKFFANLEKCRWMTPEDRKKAEEAAGIGEQVQFINQEQSKILHEALPFVNRDHGADVLNRIQAFEGDEIVLQDEFEFGRDGLFCEYAYVLDFDREELDFYMGFKKTPAPSGLWAGPGSDSEGRYGPVHLYGTWPFSELHDDTMENLEQELSE